MNPRNAFWIGGAAGLVLVALVAVPSTIAIYVHPAREGLTPDPLGLLVALALLAGLVWLVAFALTHKRRSHDPLMILRERYARGEVSQEDYTRIKETLTNELG